VVAAGLAGGLLVSGSAAAYDEGVSGELPDSFATRLVLPPGTDSIVGNLETNLDQDQFVLQGLAPGTSFTLTLDETGVGTTVQLNRLDAAGAQVQYTYSSDGNNGNTISGTVPASGLLNLDMCCREGSDGTWAVTLSQGSVSEASLRSGDLPDTFAGLALLAAGTAEVDGTIDSATDADFFAFQGLTPGDVLFVSADPPSINTVDYSVLDAGGAPLAQTSLVGSSQRGLLEVVVPPSGEVAVSAVGSEGSGMTWAVRLWGVESLTSFDEDLFGDLGNDFAGRTVLGPQTLRVQGRAVPGDAADDFAIPGLPAGAHFQLDGDSPSGGSVTYAWLDDAGSTLDSASAADGGGAVSFGGTVPPSGAVDVSVVPGGTPTWGVTLTVPEPGGVALGASALAGLAALAGLRRRS
jgi:hypothetical protein